MSRTLPRDVPLLKEAAELGAPVFAGRPGAGFLIVDPQFRIILAAGHAIRDEVRAGIGRRRLPELVSPAVWASVRPRYEAALRGEVQEFEHVGGDDGRTQHVRLAPLWEADRIAAVTVITQDITADATVARLLAESDRRLGSVFEVLDEGLMVIDATGQILQANPSAARIVGLELRPPAGGTEWWNQLRARRSCDGEPANIGRTVLSTGEPMRDVEVEIDRPDGRRVMLSVNCVPLRDDEDGVAGVVLSYRDVTARVDERRRVAALTEHLQDAHDVAGLASWEWDPRTPDEVTIVQAFAATDVQSGRTVKVDSLYRSLADGVKDELHAALQRLVEGVSPVEVRRHRYGMPDGPAWLETRARAIRDNEGRLIVVRGTSQDVTDQELTSREVAYSRDFLQATLDSLPAHIVVLDAAGEILVTNRAWSQFALAGGSPRAARGGNYLAACDAGGDQDSVAVATGLRAILDGSQSEVIREYACPTPEGERWFVLRATPFTGPGEARVVVSHEDVTERHLAEREVIKQAALLDEVEVAVVASDVDFRITHWNRGAERLTGWTAAEAIGRNTNELSPPIEPRRAAEVRAALVSGGSWNGEMRVARRDGTVYPALFHVRMINGADGEPTGMIAVSSDITERVAAERELARARDHLRAVTDSIGEGMFTLDNEGRLTYINAAGEQLLGWSSAELQGQIMHDVTHAVQPDGSPLPIDDCPISRARREGRTVRVEDDIFITRERAHLPVAYTAAPFVTQEGIEGCVVVFEDIVERKVNQRRLEREAGKLEWLQHVVDALAEDRFVLYEQPIVTAETRQVVQRELLLRMRMPGGEIVSPGQFLPLAEEYGLIGEIDRWVIARAAELAASGLAVEINLSAVSLADPGMMQHLERCLRRHAVDPRLIVIEITETALINSHSTARAFAERLRELGVKLALDDFGTGYGGLTYLKHFPVDYLKVDVEFVRDLRMSGASRRLVENIVSLARSFDIRTVAEGVEDEETLDLVTALGVDFAQGYHIGRPAPVTVRPARQKA